MVEGFRKFIMRGSVIELAVAVAIADALGPIANNLVGKMINPTTGELFGEPNFSNIDEFHVGGATVQSGIMLAALVAFLLITAAVYLAFVFLMNKLNERMTKRKGLNTEEAKVSDEVKPLTEIRGALAGGGYMNGSNAADGGYTGGGYRQ